MNGTISRAGAHVAQSVAEVANREQEQLKPQHSTMAKNVLAKRKKRNRVTTTTVQVFMNKQIWLSIYLLTKKRFGY